jgi:hypothetical protein
MRRAAVVLLAAAACTGSGMADDELAAQTLPACGEPTSGSWDDRFVLPGVTGPESIVTAMAALPDGRIVVGGTFDTANHERVRNVAFWDGTSLHDMSGGLEPVSGLAVADDGAVWAIGRSSSDPTASYIARWDGAGWTNLAQGLGAVSAIAPIAGGVAVAGQLGGMIPGAGGLAIWNGRGWVDLGIAVPPSAVASIARDDGGFCVAGSITTVDVSFSHRGVACWRAATATWAAIGPPVDLQTAGSITVANRGPDGRWWLGAVVEQSAARLAYLERNEWHVVPGFLYGRTFDVTFYDGAIRWIGFRGDDVIVAGYFEELVDQLLTEAILDPRAIAIWDGTDWATYPGGGAAGRFARVNAVVQDGDTLHVGGGFVGFSGISAANAASVDGSGGAQAWGDAAAALGATGIEGLIADADGVTALGRITAAGFVERGTARLDATWTPILGDMWFGRGDITGAARRSNGTLVVGTDYGVLAGRDGMWRSLGLDRSDRSPVVVDDRDRIYVRSYDPTSDTSEVVRIDEQERRSLGTFDGEVVALVISDGELIAGVGRWDEENEVLHQSLHALRDEQWIPLPDPPSTWSTVVAVPGLGLVVDSDDGIHAWDHTPAWRTLAVANESRSWNELAACDGGLVAERRDVAGVAVDFFDREARYEVATLPSTSGVATLAIGPLGLYVAMNPTFSLTNGAGARSELAVWRY